MGAIIPRLPDGQVVDVAGCCSQLIKRDQPAAGILLKESPARDLHA
jgi:hypothetical protein